MKHHLMIAVTAVIAVTIVMRVKALRTNLFGIA